MYVSFKLNKNEKHILKYILIHKSHVYWYRVCKYTDYIFIRKHYIARKLGLVKYCND